MANGRVQPMRLTADLVARAFRVVPETDPNEGYSPLGDGEIEALAARLAQGREAVWVFAYGSLIWKPEFTPAESRRGRARGWHRSFCIELTSWRATPDAPGLMLALAPGGSCSGLLHRIAPETLQQDMVALVRREIPFREVEGNARYITVETDAGPVEALTFYASPTGFPVTPGLPLETVAERLAQACGRAGSCAEYLFNTVSHLEAEGIRDRNLWRLQDLVAARLDAAA